jgi:myo-inositol 2-dehydrogenase / D-chiro-inositol 1-dehydrogenase
MAGASLGIGASARGLAREDAGREIGLSFIGLGDRGTQLLNIALRIPGTRIAGLCDVDPARLRRAADLAREHKPVLAADTRSLFSRAAAEAVIIASPVYLHRDHALKALDSGSHVYLEKPLALTARGAREVLAAAQAAESQGLVLQVGFQRRYSPRYQTSLETIRRGDAGKVLFIRAQWHATGDPARGNKPWYFQREKSGDIVLEQACHQMDVFNWVFDAPPLRACGLGGANLALDGRETRDIRDHYGVSLEYPNGGMVHHSHLSYAIPDRRFSGVYELVFAQNMGIDLANAISWDRSGKAVELPAPAGNDTQLAMEGFLRSARGLERPRADARVGYQATMASLLALKALDTGRMVEWSEVEDAG